MAIWCSQGENEVIVEKKKQKQSVQTVVPEFSQRCVGSENVNEGRCITNERVFQKNKRKDQ